MKDNYEIKVAGVTRQLPLFKVKDGLKIAAFIMFGDVEMARQGGENTYVVARKGPKVYMKNVVYTHVDSITTDHQQILCIGQDDIDKIKGKRVLIVDDVISTGESLTAMEKLINQVGGNIVGKMAVLAEGDAIDRDDIIYLEPLPLFDEDGNAK